MLRPQTWYLLLAALCMLLCALLVGGGLLMLSAMLLAAVVAAADIFLYTRRPLQSALVLVPMVLVLAWYLMLAMGTETRELRWPHALPLVALALLVFARKGIRHDERVVRSLDRIR